MDLSIVGVVLKGDNLEIKDYMVAADQNGLGEPAGFPGMHPYIMSDFEVINRLN
jgi:hypothetical protein